MMIKKLALLFVALPSLVFAQSSPNWPTGYRPSMVEWNAEFASKQDFGGVQGFLPLTGGTVTGTTTFVGVGIGLSVANNANVGGNFAVGGALSAGGFNNTSPLGYQINGRTGLFLTPTNIPIEGTASQQGVFVGPNAGQYFATNNVVARFGMTAVGVDALQFLQSNGAETVCVGQFSCRQLVTTYGVTALGQSVMSGETFSGALYATGIGNDTMRDTVGNFNSTATGAESQRDGVGHTNTSSGAFSLHGNSGSLVFSGTATSGDILHITFASAAGGTTGLPAIVNYTVQPADTLATIAAGVANAITAQLTVGYILPNGSNILAELGLTNWVSAFVAPLPGGPPIVGMHWFGGSTTGMAITFTTTCTGTCTEVMTVRAPFSGTDNLAAGMTALYGVGLTSGSFNHARGTAALANLGGTSSGVQCDGYNACYNALTGAASVAMGQQVVLNATQLNSSVVIAPFMLGTANPMTDWVIIGAGNSTNGCFGSGVGGVSLGFGDCPLSPSINWQLSIQNGAIAGLNNNKGGGGAGGGQIGVEIAAGSVMNATFTISDYGGAATYGSHFRVHQTTAPALSACGGSPTIDPTASDTSGTATEGTTATGCVITFATAYATTPHCSVSNWAGNAQPVTLSACSTTALTVTNSSGTGNKFTYQVIQ